MMGLFSGVRNAMVDVASKIVADDQDVQMPQADVESAHVEFADVLMSLRAALT